MPEAIGDPWGGRGGEVEGVRDPLDEWLPEWQVWREQRRGRGPLSLLSACPLVHVSTSFRAWGAAHVAALEPEATLWSPGDLLPYFRRVLAVTGCGTSGT